MTPTREELEDADCWFSTDAAGGAAMTSFKREARWRQHLWAKERGVREFGSHPGRKPRPGAEATKIVNGTKLTDADAEARLNLLTDGIDDVAAARTKNPEAYETLNAQRLRGDLLSSMPMAFNLLGEASFTEHEVPRHALAEAFGVPASSPSAIRFEWSPGRRSADYTRDRTAFDVALVLGEDGPQTVVGIETKYHEHASKEPAPKAKSRVAHQHQTEFLVEKANASGAFRDGWEEKVLDTDLRQIWRDHVLALSMRQHPERWTASTKYVLLHPSGNVSFADAARRYSELLVDGNDSFAALTIEDVLDAAFAHGDSTKEAFDRRYLAWMSDR